MTSAASAMSGRSIPSTADFPWSFDEHKIERLGGGKYRVVSYVDAQNGFGAQIRSNYLCEISTADAGEHWRAEKVVILGR